MIKHFVLGAGKMTEAIFMGLSQKISLRDAAFYSPSGTSAKNLADKVGAHFSQELNVPSETKYLWLGLKPQGLEMLRGLGAKLPADIIVISMLAAIDEKTQRDVLGVKKLIRIMPNLPVKFNSGVTLIASESAKENLKEVQNFLIHTGKVQEVSEIDLEKLTLLTGSGPAFIYEFIKNLSQQFDHPEAEVLVRSVLLGCADTLKNDETSLDNLISAVTSKGGVTIAVLEKWRESNFNALIGEGIKAGRVRSKELSQK